MTTPRRDWRISSYSGTNGACVEVARTDDGGALVRDSKHRHGGHLTIAPAAWHAFLAAVRTGRA